MISKYHILIFCLSFVLGSCANSSNSSKFAEATKSIQEEEVDIDSATEEIDLDSDNSNVEAEKQEEDEAIAEASIPEAPKRTQTEAPEVKRKASTIAEQQEAARKIQDELNARNPKPNEDNNLENAVFEKVVEKPKPKKPAPKNTQVKKKEKKDWPAIEFEEMTMVFDTITQGDIIEHNFIFTNTGNAPLEIKSAAATCGCTRPSYPFIPIEPNEQGRISVTYNSVGKEGFQNPEVTIKTNISSKEIVLMMEGFVLVPQKAEGNK